jgi:AmmeMemoRadiSam system protein B
MADDRDYGLTPAVIVPHAGWHYSGKLAAKTISAAVKSFGPQGPELIVVLGGHLPWDGPLIAYPESSWETPLGSLKHEARLNQLLPSSLSPRLWSGPSNDNTVEVLLPFIKFFCPQAPIWALRVSPGENALSLAKLLFELSTDKDHKILIVGSTDLTHYGRAYGFAPAGGGPEGERFRKQNDLAFIEACLKPDPVSMMTIGCEKQAACSSGAAAAAALAADLGGAKGILIDHYSSNDVRSGDQSVGYAGVIYGCGS